MKYTKNKYFIFKNYYNLFIINNLVHKIL